MDRRDFIKFFSGASALATAPSLLTSCIQSNHKTKPLAFSPIDPSLADELKLAPEFKYEILLKWGDRINNQGEEFGFNNDFISLIPKGSDRAIMWVNHEYANPIFMGLKSWENKRTKEIVDIELKNVGGSIVEIFKEDGEWHVDQNSSLNKRIDGTTKIPFSGGVKIQGSDHAMGTIANCAGGQTPWGTFLSCEENYDNFYGERAHGSKTKTAESTVGWDKIYNNPPEHYGWVVEVDPISGTAKKHIGLGRFAHECATVTKTKDGRVVVYTGDDTTDQCLYKFISKTSDSLEGGELFVANVDKGEWISLDINKHEILQATFKDQTEVLMNCQKAADLVGGSKLNRPEDIEIHPVTGEVFIALTKSPSRGDMFGSIVKVSETGGDHGAMSFSYSTFMAGGKYFANPDNLVFDNKGDLWMVTDISGSKIGKKDYAPYGNNGLFYIPTNGVHAGKAYQVASAPVDAEFTGVCFSSDYKTLFMSVQHPGELSKSINELTSHWPEGGDSWPRPAVVQISSKFFERT